LVYTVSCGLLTLDSRLSTLDFRLSTALMVFEQLKIRNVAIRPAHILAPMAGITDTVFRRFIKRLGGCGLIMSEFVSSEGMIRLSRRSRRYLYYTEEERPISAQIFGADPEHLAEASAVIDGNSGLMICSYLRFAVASRRTVTISNGLTENLKPWGEVVRDSCFLSRASHVHADFTSRSGVCTSTVLSLPATSRKRRIVPSWSSAIFQVTRTTSG
jgi:hypothetical protein